MIWLLLLAGTPLQWAILALVVVVLFAPQLLPLLARLLGLEARRRLLSCLPPMLRPRPRRPPAAPEPPDAAQPAGPRITPRAGDPGPVIRDAVPAEPPGPRRPAGQSPWPIVLAASVAALVLLWLLLRPQ